MTVVGIAREARLPEARARRDRRRSLGRGDPEPLLVQGGHGAVELHAFDGGLDLRPQLLVALAERHPPDEAGGMQVVELQRRVLLGGPGADRVARDVGVGAPRQDRLHGVGVGAVALHRPADLPGQLGGPAVVDAALVHRDGLARVALERLGRGGAGGHHELEVGVEIALGEEDALGALLGDGGGGDDEVVGPRGERRQQARELRGHDLHLDAEAFADGRGEVHVEALDAARQRRHGVGREGPVERHGVLLLGRGPGRGQHGRRDDRRSHVSLLFRWASGVCRGPDRPAGSARTGFVSFRIGRGGAVGTSTGGSLQTSNFAFPSRLAVSLSSVERGRRVCANRAVRHAVRLRRTTADPKPGDAARLIILFSDTGSPRLGADDPRRFRYRHRGRHAGSGRHRRGHVRRPPSVRGSRPPADRRSARRCPPPARSRRPRGAARHARARGAGGAGGRAGRRGRDAARCP